jgi:hypothetical protein
MHALAMTVHAVLLAGGAPGGEVPAEIPRFHEGFNHKNKKRTIAGMSQGSA